MILELWTSSDFVLVFDSFECVGGCLGEHCVWPILSFPSHPSESIAGAEQANSSGIGSSPTLSPSQSNFDVRKEGLHKLV